MGIFKKREAPVETTDEALLQALIGGVEINRENVMNIPAVSACVNKIGDTVSAVEIKLYKRNGDKVEEVEGDNRIKLLNDETGDTLDASQWKKAMVTDMFLGAGGYTFINKIGNEIKSIHYVESNKVSFQYSSDPIFKDYKISVYGKDYEPWQFIKLLRNTQNGWKGKSIIEESIELLSIIYASQIFEKNLVKTGGNKKGFVKAEHKLTTDAMNSLKSAFRKLYSNSSDNVVILNNGLDFKESSNTSVEMQLNENKKTNSSDVCKIFLIPPSIIEGGASEEDKKLFLEGCIVPILNRFEKAINSVMLSEDEKKHYFFAFDTSDLIKSDIEKRYNAYKLALDSGFMQLDEVRKREKLPAFGLDFIKLGLQDVLYYPATNEVYTPNTNKLSTMDKIGDDLSDKNEQEGGDVNEDRN